MYVLLKRLSLEEDGQGLMEYTFVGLLAALVFWLGVRDTNIGTTLTGLWVKISACVYTPFSCTA